MKPTEPVNQVVNASMDGAWAGFLSLSPHWFWLTIGVILAAAEMVAPGFFLIWLALAAIITGIVAAIIPDLSFTLQMGVFALFAVITVYSGRRWFVMNPIESDDPALNNKGARLTGEVVTVADAIINGRGKVIVGDSVWLARGADAAKGTQVRVIGADGAELLVEVV